MAKAKKLPSGSWRAQVYSHTELVTDEKGKPVMDQKTGKQKERRVYESFTSDDPTSAGKKEAEYQAAEFAMNKKKITRSNITFGEALDKYIEQRSAVLSPASIRKYKAMRKNVLQSLMPKKLKDIDQDIVQGVINEESKTHAPKSVRDMHGLITAVLKQNRVNLMLTTVLPKKVHLERYIPSDDDIKRLIDTVKESDMEIPVYLASFGAMRRGEISALLSTDVTDTTIHVSKTMVLDDNNNWIVKAPKTYSSDRYIELPSFVTDLLKIKEGNITDMTPNIITSRFSHILKQAGLPSFRFHDLRHANVKATTKNILLFIYQQNSIT